MKRTQLLSLAIVIASSSVFAQTRTATTTQALQDAAGDRCASALTKTPPFYDSESQTPDVDYAQTRADRPEFAGYLPKNSIVKLTQPRGFSLDRLMGTDYVNIQVLSVPNLATDTNARLSPSQIRQPVVGAGSRLRPGSRGQIQFSNLRPAGDLTYVVTKNAPVLQIPGGQLSLAGRPIRLAKTSNPLGGTFYKINRCCPGNVDDNAFTSYVRDAAERVGDGLGLSSVCHDNYIYEVLNPTTFCPQTQLELRGDCDAFANSLRPINADQLRAVQRISQLTSRGPDGLELIDSSGLVKIPVDPVTGIGPFGSYHAYKNPRPEPGNSMAVSYDAFLQATSACAFMRVLEANAARCRGPGCQVQWNDAYHPFKIQGEMSHVSHTKDSCIDVFPLSKTTRGPGSVKWTDGNYDRAKTLALIDLMVRAGADVSQLGFNDPEAIRRFGTQKWEGHDNHIHVCFPNETRTGPRGTALLSSNVQQVQKTCQNGLLPPPPPPPAIRLPALSSPVGAPQIKTPEDLPALPAAPSGGTFGFLSPNTCQ